MGALISEDAASRVLSHVQRAHTQDGATLLCGGGSAASAVGAGLEGGYYVQPTILASAKGSPTRRALASPLSLHAGCYYRASNPGLAACTL